MFVWTGGVGPLDGAGTSEERIRTGSAIRCTEESTIRRMVLGEAARWRSSWEMPEKRRSSIGRERCVSDCSGRGVQACTAQRSAHTGDVSNFPRKLLSSFSSVKSSQVKSTGQYPTSKIHTRSERAQLAHKTQPHAKQQPTKHERTRHTNTFTHTHTSVTSAVILRTVHVRTVFCVSRFTVNKKAQQPCPTAKQRWARGEPVALLSFSSPAFPCYGCSLLLCVSFHC